jgi:hypothetical protein
MIQPVTENKYRFNMQVSARAMGCRALTFLRNRTGAGAAHDCRRFEKRITDA